MGFIAVAVAGALVAVAAAVVVAVVVVRRRRRRVGVAGAGSGEEHGAGPDVPGPTFPVPGAGSDLLTPAPHRFFAVERYLFADNPPP